MPGEAAWAGTADVTATWTAVAPEPAAPAELGTPMAQTGTAIIAPIAISSRAAQRKEDLAICGTPVELRRTLTSSPP